MLLNTERLRMISVISRLFSVIKCSFSSELAVAVALRKGCVSYLMQPAAVKYPNLSFGAVLVSSTSFGDGSGELVLLAGVVAAAQCKGCASYLILSPHACNQIFMPHSLSPLATLPPSSVGKKTKQNTHDLESECRLNGLFPTAPVTIVVTSPP